MQVQVDELGLPILDQFSEEGFIDCVFKINNLRSEADQYLFHLAASFDGEVVGIDVRVVKSIKAGFDENMELNDNHVYYEGVEFTRSGAESDRLLRAITQLYDLKASGTRMVDTISFTGIALHQGDIDVEAQPVKIKLFGNDADTDNEDDYFESFFNLDLPNGLVFWNEKDQDYREPLVRSLTASVA
jgi:hypothetical protein